MAVLLEKSLGSAGKKTRAGKARVDSPLSLSCGADDLEVLESLDIGAKLAATGRKAI
jgi:hypothetical protein